MSGGCEAASGTGNNMLVEAKLDLSKSLSTVAPCII